VNTYRDKIDTAFFGTSHIYAGLNPYTFDKKTGCFTMGCGSGGQGMKETYYYIRQMKFSCKNLKNVFVDVYFENFQLRVNNQGSKMQNQMIVLERITHPMAKMFYVYNCFDVNEYVYAICPAMYYNNRIGNIGENISGKLSSSYLNYESSFSGFKEDYMGMGYIPNHAASAEGETYAFGSHIQFTKDIDYPAFDYLLKIVNYCKDNQLNLFLVQMPFSETSCAKYADFLSYYDQLIDDFVNKNNLTYLNLNRHERPKLQEKDIFYDGEHLNYKGADLYTSFIADFYNKNAE